MGKYSYIAAACVRNSSLEWSSWVMLFSIKDHQEWKNILVAKPVRQSCLYWSGRTLYEETGCNQCSKNIVDGQNWKSESEPFSHKHQDFKGQKPEDACTKRMVDQAGWMEDQASQLRQLRMKLIAYKADSEEETRAGIENGADDIDWN